MGVGIVLYILQALLGYKALESIIGEYKQYFWGRQNLPKNPIEKQEN